MRSLLVAPRRLIFADVDPTFEICAVLDEDTLRSNVARKDRRLSQLNAFFSIDVAVDASVNNHFFGVDVRANSSIRSNGEVIVVQLDRALDFSVDKQVFAAGKFSLHHHRLANVGNITPTLITGSICVHGTDLLIPFFLARASSHDGH